MVVLRPWAWEQGIGETPRRLMALQERKGPVSSRRGLPLGLRGKGGEERSRLVELLARHQVGELLATAGARGVTCSERAGIPSVGSDVVERQAFPLLVQVSQGKACRSTTSLPTLGIPARSLQVTPLAPAV